MKPHSYYRRPDRLVGIIDRNGRFAHALTDQLTAEEGFTVQRLKEACRELCKTSGDLTARAVFYTALRWGVSGQQLAHELKKGGAL